ncbi:hypothetical protein TB2_046170 [Malus domestica]
MLQGIIFTCLICSPCKCGIFFESTSAAEDEYSKAMLDADTSGKDWHLFDIWDRCFDKLPVISAKLSVHVTDADTFGKADAFSISELASSSSKLRRVQRLHVTSADKSRKEDWPVVYE